MITSIIKLIQVIVELTNSIIKLVTTIINTKKK